MSLVDTPVSSASLVVERITRTGANTGLGPTPAPPLVFFGHGKGECVHVLFRELPPRRRLMYPAVYPARKDQRTQYVIMARFGLLAHGKTS
jgi:hypothetical protein